MRGRARYSRSVRANLNNGDSRPEGRDKNTQTGADKLMDLMEHARVEWDRKQPKSNQNRRESPVVQKNS